MILRFKPSAQRAAKAQEELHNWTTPPGLAVIGSLQHFWRFNLLHTHVEERCVRVSDSMNKWLRVRT
jgi:hypothetical protein